MYSSLFIVSPHPGRVVNQSVDSRKIVPDGPGKRMYYYFRFMITFLLQVF